MTDNQRITVSSETRDSARVMIERDSARSTSLPTAAGPQGAIFAFGRVFPTVVSKRSDSSKRLPDFSNARMHTLLLHAEITSVENNKLHNTRSLNYLFNTSRFSEVKLFGKTMFLDYSYNFPIFCSRLEFVEFLRDVRGHPDRKKLFQSGILTMSLFHAHKNVWRNFLSQPSCFRAGSVRLSRDTPSLIGGMFWFLLNVFLFFIAKFCFDKAVKKKKNVVPPIAPVFYLPFYIWQNNKFGNVCYHAKDPYRSPVLPELPGGNSDDFIVRSIAFVTGDEVSYCHKYGEIHYFVDPKYCHLMADFIEIIPSTMLRRIHFESFDKYAALNPLVGSLRAFAVKVISIFVTIPPAEAIIVSPTDFINTPSEVDPRSVYDDFYVWQVVRFGNVVFLPDDPKRNHYVSFEAFPHANDFDFVVRSVMFVTGDNTMRYHYEHNQEIVDVQPTYYSRMGAFFDRMPGYGYMAFCNFVNVYANPQEASALEGNVFKRVCSSVIANVFFEEVLKKYILVFVFGWYSCLAFALFEYLVKIIYGVMSSKKRVFYFAGVLPIFMHVFTGFLSFTFGFMFHFAWNFVAFLLYQKYPNAYIFGSLGVTILEVMKQYSPDPSSVEEISYALDVLNKVVNKDVLGLAFSAGMRASYFANLLQLLNCKNPGELLFVISDDRIIMLSADSAFFSLLESILPEFVNKSPTFKRFAAFGLIVASSTTFSELSAVKHISSLMDWTAFEGASTFLEVTIGAVVAFYQALKRVTQVGSSWKDIFGLPADVAFIRAARSVLLSEHDTDSADALESKIKAVEDLIKAREFKYNTSEVVGLVNKLTEFVKVKRDHLDNFKHRNPPMPIFLCGAPGTGKTICQDILVDLFRRVLNLEPFPGDTIFYNILLKFPGELNKSKKAQFFVGNDLPADYSRFVESDREALDIVLQRLIDTSPYEIRSAAVGDKGKALNEIKVAMFSSNYTRFVGEQDADKLMRRLSSGVAVRVYFEGKDGRLLKYEQISHLSDSDRNAFTKFRLTKPKSDAKQFWFEDTEVVYSLPEFLRYTLSKYQSHEEKMQLEWDKFKSPAAKCECGAPHSVHYVTGRMGIVYHRIGDLCPEIPSRPPVDQMIILESIDGDNSLQGHFLLYSIFFLQLLVCVMFFYEKYTKYAGVIRNYIVLSSSFQWVYKTCRKLMNSKYEFSHDRAFHWFVSMNKAESFVRSHSTVLISLALVTLTYFAHKKVSTMTSLGNPIFRENVDPDSMLLLETDKVQAFNPEQVRTWAKKEGNIRVAKLHHEGTGREDLIRMVKRNTFKAEILREKVGTLVGSPCLVFALNAKWMIMNKHYVVSKAEKMTEFFIMIDGRKQGYLLEEMISVENTEFFMFRNFYDPAVSPLIDHLVLDIGEGPVDCYSLVDDKQFLGHVGKMICPEDDIVYPAILIPYDYAKGTCSTPVLLNSRNGWCIGGFVFAKAKTEDVLLNVFHYNQAYISAACPVTRESFIKAAKADVFPEYSYHKVSAVALGSFGDLSPNADVRNLYDDLPDLIPLGSLLKPGKTFVSKMIKTCMHDDFVQKLSEEYVPPSLLKGVNSDGDYTSVFIETMANVSRVNEISYSKYRDAMVAYVDDALPVSYIKKACISLRCMTIPEGLFGDSSISVDRVPFNTSVGKTLREMGCTDKYMLFEPIEGSDKLRLKPSFLERLRLLKSSIDSGILPALIVEYQVKDELRKKSKALKFKFRLFSIVDFEYNLLLRCHVMPIIVVLMSNPHFSECYGGINAGGKAWTELVLRLKRFGFYIDMDFKTFDQTHSAFIISLVAEFFYLAALRCGYPTEDAVRLYRLILMLKLQVLFYQLDIMFKYFGLPSGVIITLIMNSVVNSIIMRVAFAYLTKMDPRRFREFVVMATCGDDNISSIDERIIAVFNMVTIQIVYKALGYSVTPADKSGAVREHIPFEEATFLKRRFVWSEELGYYLAPIELDSIYKALCFQMKDAEVTARVRLTNVAQTVQREAWLHGRSFFDQVQSELIVAFDRHQLTLGLRLLSFEEIAEEFRSGTFKTFMC